MKKSHIKLNKIKLIGITTRTSNLLEMKPQTSQIAATIDKYFKNRFCELISNRSKPGTTYCVYTDYENDENGKYTYFIGEEVNSFEGAKPQLKTLVIPAQNYTKFTLAPGIMPNICIDAWKKIWQMPIEELGGKRSFIADFEIYDERAKDPKNTSLDIYIGIN